MNLRTAPFFILLLPCISWGQVGGERSFEFINLPNNARTAALGGVQVSNTENPVDGIFSNPALLDSVESGSIAFTHLGFVADIGLNSLAYAHEFKRIGTMGFGIQYMNFGEFEGFDPSGVETGTFNANEYSLMVGYSHRISVFALGANLKFASSGIESFRASALLMDIGGQFTHPTKELSVGLTFKNLGFYLSDYTSTGDSKVPFDVQVGATFKPEYMPVRFTMTAYNLYQGDLTVFNPDSDIELVNEEAGGFDKVFRHFNIGTEFLIHRNVNLRMGYNHLIRKELRLDAKSGGAGFSFGFLVKVKSFELAYTRAIYHVSGGGNFFTLGTNLNRVIKKKRTA